MLVLRYYYRWAKTEKYRTYVSDWLLPMMTHQWRSGCHVIHVQMNTAPIYLTPACTCQCLWVVLGVCFHVFLCLYLAHVSILHSDLLLKLPEWPYIIKLPVLFWFQGKLASEQHIRELCGSMIDGEKSLNPILNSLRCGTEGEFDLLIFSVVHRSDCTAGR